MRTLWRILQRTVFWSYERGTWQYDIAVVAIVLFVLATPRIWFHDQPQVGAPGAPGLVMLVTEDNMAQTYRVDARALAPPTRTPELQSDLHSAMQKAVPALHGRGFEITDIEAIRDANGIVVAYTVQVKR